MIGVTSAPLPLERSLERVERNLALLTRSVARTQRLIRRLEQQNQTRFCPIEDTAYIVLHDVLKRELGWDVRPLERSWQRWNGQPEEIDVFGQAADPARPGHAIWIVGEAKHNLTVSEVRRFAAQAARARRHLAGEVFAVCFCYRARPEVQQAVRDAGLRLVFSYGKLV
jgi:hypothetical protein